ncbi:AAA family ATPase [Haladaptatus sp. CMAA 1911]|uniref:AAA family ATPase n=1 Tax=unclassified Haladaptatus TaxID=2622732 RepID=UPI0037545D4E
MKQVVKPVTKRNAGHGLVVLVPGAMEQLSVAEGDFVRIEGEEGDSAIAGVLAGSIGRDGIRIDRHLRRAVGTDVGDTVSVTSATVSPATSVTITLSTHNWSIERERTVRSELEGRAVTADQTLAVPMEFTSGTNTGTHTADTEHHLLLHVLKTQPTGVVVVRDGTHIEFVTGDSDGSETVTEKTKRGDTNGTVTTDRDSDVTVPGLYSDQRATYDDIGGLDTELERVREAVELPLCHPERFRQFDVDPPRGVLLYGPPGTGKTLMVRAIATELDVHFEVVSATTIASKYYGETEERLRAVFERARANEPSIILVDELDSIARERSETTGDAESRVIAQLISLLDGFGDRQRTTIIGTTNREDAIDPALRRPGRFDREVEIGVPDVGGREEILRIHSRDIPFAPDVTLRDYAEKTHGFVGADLENLARESVMHALQRVDLPNVGGDSAIDKSALTNIEVTADDFDAAMRKTEPSALREVFVEVPEVSWTDIGGLEDVKTRLRETVQWPFEYPEAFERVDLRPATGILLHGPPGTGKTLLAKAVANEAESNFISIQGPELLDKYVGESEKGIRDVFTKARENAPTVVFFDEIDAIATERGGNVDSSVGERVVSQLLTELDGLEELENVVVIAATNRPELLDDALLRQGRLDHHVEVGPPDETARRKIFEIHAAKKPLDDVDFEALARRTDGFVGADIEAICREAAVGAVREFVDMEGSDPKRIVLCESHFERAVSKTKETESNEAFTRIQDRSDGATR